MICLRSLVIGILFFQVLPLSFPAEAEPPKKLKVVYNTGVAPLKFEDESGRPAGMFPDLWELWAAKAGRDIEFVRADSFADSLDLLRNGKADLHAGLFKTAEELSFLSKTVSIKVHNENDRAPYNYNENGSPKGHSVDYVSLLAERTGLEVQFLNHPSRDEFLSMMKSGELDVMMNIAKTPEREKYLEYTHPYATVDQTLFTRRDFPAVSSVKDLSGKTLAVPRGFYIRHVLSRYPEVGIMDVEDMTEALFAVSNGRAHGVIKPEQVVIHLAGELGIGNLKPHPEFDIPEEESVALHMAVSKEKPILAAILEKGMKRISDGEMQNLREKWLDGPKISDQMSTLTDEEKDWLRRHPKLRIGADPSFAPFEFFSDGEYAGMAADYVAILSERLGIEFRPLTGLTWSETCEKARKGEIDILPCVGISEERKRYFAHTKPYLQFVRVIITRRDGTVNGLEDLARLRVGVRENSSHHGFLKEYTEVDPILFTTFEDAMLALSKGEADALVGNMAVASYTIRKLMLTNLKIAKHISGRKSPLAMAVRKDYQVLVSILDKAFATVTPEEHWKIRSKWIGVGMDETNTTLLLTAKKREWLEDHPVIRVSSEPDYAPFDFTENGRPAGFSIDYLRILEKRLRIRFEFVCDTWGNLLEKCRQKEIDLLHTIFKTDERAGHYLFTGPTTVSWRDVSWQARERRNEDFLVCSCSGQSFPAICMSHIPIAAMNPP